MSRSTTVSDDRPGVAIISNSQTPYRLHLHQRIARQLPQIKLWSLYTHEISNAPWAFEASDEIGAVLFGKGESAQDQANWKNSLREWKRGGRIIQWLEEQGIRFVLMMGYNDAGRMRIMRWCHGREIPCFMFGDSNIRGDNVGGVKAIVKRLFVGRVVAWCTGMLSCGSLGREYFLKYGTKPDRIYYFPYEPDYELIERLDPAFIEQTRARFGLGENRRRLVFSGRLIRVKRADLLIDAFRAIAAGRPEWNLLMIGDGPLRDELQNRLGAELAGRVTWTGFIDDQKTVSALYRLSDCLVLPSDYEPWALVINEAAAAGMAIVSSDVVGAAAELVRDKVNGRLFEPGDLAGLIACLNDVTEASKIDRYKRASAAVLADWRSRGDPVQGLRQALIFSGVIQS